MVLPKKTLIDGSCRCILQANVSVLMVYKGLAARYPHLSNLRMPRSPERRSYFTTSKVTRSAWEIDDGFTQIYTPPTFQIPQRIQQKVISAEDAVSLVRDGDTICVSGFVCQGAAEAVLKALGERYKDTQHPSNLTLLFGGGPGDWDKRGLNHLAQLPPEGSGEAPMLRRTIGSHYGQTPMLARLALRELVEAWTLPMGSVSRMLRSQSTHSPGHITDIGIGTYIDPDLSGGAVNESAKNSPFHKQLVTKLSLGGHEHLMYKSLPIDVAIIRGTTADVHGNISIEQESVNCDQMITAAAARNSGGIVIAQVKHLAADGSLPSRSVEIPGPLVDCIVVVDAEDHDDLHPMSYVEKFNPVLTGTIRAPQDKIPKMPLNIRKIIARRAFFGLQPNVVTNLGIGLPEGVASVAAEEGVLNYVTLSTEPGIFGGVPASGHSFGPAYNANAVVEMNKMFDYYDGGGLDMCFLGAAQVSKNGDVNVSRISPERLTGPGGFIDISQPTKNIYFMTTLTTAGLKVSIPGNGTLKVEEEGKVRKFVSEVFEKTFSGDEAVKRGQTVYYITERAVFRRSANHDVLELIEIAPGMDLQQDILDRIDFQPVVSKKLKRMDPRIFLSKKMNVKSEFFGSLDESIVYHHEDHTLFAELGGITIDSQDDINWFVQSWKHVIDPLVKEKGSINVVVNYDGFDIRKDLEENFSNEIEVLENRYYKNYNNVTRFTSKAFKRAKLGKKLHLSDWDLDSIFDRNMEDNNSIMSLECLREVVMKDFHIHLTTNQLKKISADSTSCLDRDTFKTTIIEILKSKE